MMKNTATRLLLAILTLSLLPISAMAGMGLHIGWDMNSQDAYDLERIQINPSFPDEVAITAEKIDKSLLAGIHFTFGMLPLVDLEFGFEGSFTKYRLLYENFPTSGPIEKPIDEDVPFARVGFYTTGKYNVIKMPMVKGYVGAGLNYNIVTPLLTKTFVEAETSNGDYNLSAEDVTKILGEQAGVGMHLAFGVRGKPAAMPITIYGEGRLYFLPENDYGDETNKFFSIVFGLDIGF